MTKAQTTADPNTGGAPAAADSPEALHRLLHAMAAPIVSAYAASLTPVFFWWRRGLAPSLSTAGRHLAGGTCRPRQPDSHLIAQPHYRALRRTARSRHYNAGIRRGTSPNSASRQ